MPNYLNIRIPNYFLKYLTKTMYVTNLFKYFLYIFLKVNTASQV